MFLNKKFKRTFFFLIVLLALSAAVSGTALGLMLAVNRNTRNLDEIMASRQAIPSRVLDRNGELITEFFSDEKRDIIHITSLPENQIYAILTREDAPFFKHTGFSVVGFLRALTQTVRYVISGQGSLQGGSTITMQLAGSRHADRTDISIRRKLKETWWAYQLERRFTKQEILEQYINSVYFGHNTYGIEAASQFFFGHSSVENSPAESVMLAIQLAGSGLYSPLIHPNSARTRQREILNQMIAAGHVKKHDADESFQTYWSEFDWSRSSTDSPYFNRLAQDKAPYFSEYIRTEVEKYLFGQQDIYRDGYVIHTSLDLDIQRAAEKEIQKGLQIWNTNYRNDHQNKTSYISSELVENIDLLSLAFNIPEIHIANSVKKRKARDFLDTQIAPLMDMVSMTFGITHLKNISKGTYARTLTHKQMNNVETALITLDNERAYILAMIGGSQFNRNNQFNRAISANVMPGSAFKPLYYSAAISSKTFTPGSMIYDGPEQFISPDGKPYIPKNYNGRWHGYVLIRDALARSLNIPALKVLESIGFDAAINRSAALLGIDDAQTIGETFDRVYPLGLGTLSITPIQIARAYASFANRGRSLEPLSILYIEDRDGNIIVNPEQDYREEQLRSDIQVMSPQSAYLMADMLKSTVEYGTLSYARRSVEGFDGMAMAGKTGTTQNWTDAWTVGFSPYYTTALWIGFDKRGNSLGRNQTGAQATGPVWAQYMKTIHKNLPKIDFAKPEIGILRVSIDKRTGMLPEEDTEEKYLRNEVFLAGTQPDEHSTMHSVEKERNESRIIKFATDSSNINLDDGLVSSLSTRDLLSEIGIQPLYLNLQRSRSNRSSTSSVLD